MFEKLKGYILCDVTNPNENADGAITLRMCSIISIAYLLFLSGLVLGTKGTGAILCNLAFIIGYVYAFRLTYCDNTRGALLWFNGATLGFVCFNVAYLGWDSGIQHFLFVLILDNELFCITFVVILISYHSISKSHKQFYMIYRPFYLLTLLYACL